MKRIARHTKKFRRDYKRLSRSQKRSIRKLDEIVRSLVRGKKPDRSCHDHGLHGPWKGCRDCHVEGDLILVYELSKNDHKQEVITFHAVDNHEHLFE